MRKWIMIFAFLVVTSVHGNQVDYIFNGHEFKNVYYEDFLDAVRDIVGEEVESQTNE